MHNVMPGSRAYIERLGAAAQRAGVTFLLETRVERALVDGAGRVTGVVCSRHDALEEMRAARGVILATGDFSGNADLRRRFLSPAAAAAIPINPGSTGDGHRLAMAIGADARNMDVIFGPQLRFAPPPGKGLVERLPSWRWLGALLASGVNRVPAAWLRPLARSLLITHMSPSKELFAEGAILVNLDGERFCDERRGIADLALQREATGYIVLDGEIARRFNRYPYFISTAPGIAYAYFADYARGRPDLVHEGDAVTLAAALGLDRRRLERSIAGAPRPLRPPFHALGPARSMLTVTEGGLAVDERCRVLDGAGRPIAGLFAAGGVGQGGLQLFGHGLHLAWAMTSGRIAGAAAASERPPGRSAIGEGGGGT
jgi:fumarate reductase flavoprotein subunit